MKKHLTLLTFSSMIALSMFGSKSFAQNITSQDQVASATIKSAVVADFIEHYSISMDHEKSEFGTQSDETFKNAQLGDGIPYYKLDNNQEFIFNGYIFPVQLDGKSPAIVYASDYTGTWKVEDIQNYSNFEQSLNDAEKGLKNGDSTKLIIDRRYGVKALDVQGTSGENIISLDNKHTKISITDFKNKIKQLDDKSATGKNGIVKSGSGAVSLASSSSSNFLRNIIVIPIIALTLISGVFLLMKRKKTNSNL